MLFIVFYGFFNEVLCFICIVLLVKFSVFVCVFYCVL